MMRSNVQIRFRGRAGQVRVEAAILGLLTILLMACGASNFTQETANPTAPTTEVEELVFYDWDEDMPQNVLDDFYREFGITVKYLVYESQEVAIADLEAGKAFDVVVMESRFIPQLVREGLLAELDPRNLPNLKNLSANFRELAYDPDNRYSVPYNWGTTGLVVRSDLVEHPFRRWVDLWDPRYAGKVGIWFGQPREVLGFTLKSLGYSANSENPTELEEALQQLIKIKPDLVALEDYDASTSADALVSGKILVAMGYAYDFIVGHEVSSAIAYVLPLEGGLLWNDAFVIPANSPRKAAAELFLNFLMRPDINAEIANQNLYATPNEAALPMIKPEILNNPVIFPPNEEILQAELILPLSPQGQKLYDKVWEQFIAAP